MSNDEMRQIKFTGERTGLTGFAVRGHGVLAPGDVIEVPAEQAERWTTQLPMRDGESGSDWAYADGDATNQPDEVDEPDETTPDEPGEENAPRKAAPKRRNTKAKGTG